MLSKKLKFGYNPNKIQPIEQKEADSKLISLFKE